MTCSCAHAFTRLRCAPELRSLYHRVCVSSAVAAYTPAAMPQREVSGNTTRWPTWSFHYVLVLGNTALSISSMHHGQMQGICLSSLLLCTTRLFQLYSSPRSCNTATSELWLLKPTQTLLSSPADAVPLSLALTVLCVKSLRHRECLLFRSAAPAWASPGDKRWWGAVTQGVPVLTGAGSWELGAVGKAVIQAAICLFPVPQGITSLFSSLSKTMRNRCTLIG